MHGTAQSPSQTMLNLHESLRTHAGFNRLEIGELLFAEYTCPVDVARLSQWSASDYLVHVLSGRKTWHTCEGAWPAREGDTLYFRKGAATIEQFFDVEFCLLLFFIPDDLVRNTVRELAGSLVVHRPAAAPIRSAARVTRDVGLTAFLESMRAYFSGREKPAEPLLRLKLKELVVSLLTGRGNPALAAYFVALASQQGPALVDIMEANFRFNLSLDEYAALCHRSLSSFKRDFRRQFQDSPGRWLLHRRLDHAAALLRNTEASVTEIVFESGFEDVTHFSRTFKERFQLSPTAYRQAIPAAT
jgi:AraC-like DNA-binding protein